MSSKQKMIEQSYNLFCEYGENFSLSQVTDVIGIKKQSIYNYFSGKDELIIEMLNYKIETYYNNSENAFDDFKDLDLKERLYKMGKFTISVFESEQSFKFRRWVSLSMSTKGIEDVKDLIKLNESKFKDLVRGLLQGGIDSEVVKNTDIDFIVTAYFVLLKGIIDGILNVENHGYSQEFFKKTFEYYWIMITRNL
ncbi:MAG: TetR/AcrR family transcriptional regulator [Acidaminobacteraceae bacterium]